MSIETPMSPEVTGEGSKEQPPIEQEMTGKLELFRKNNDLTIEEMNPDRFIWAAKDSFRTAWGGTEKEEDPLAWEIFLKSEVGNLLGEKLLTPQEDEEFKRNYRLIPSERFEEKQPYGGYYDIDPFDHIDGEILAIRKAIDKMGPLKRIKRRVFKK